MNIPAHILWLAPSDTKIRIKIIPGAVEYSPEIAAATDANWAERLEQNPDLFDGPVWALKDWRASAAEDSHYLDLQLQITTYKYVLFTHFTPAGLALPRASRSNALGCSAITLTADNKVVLGLRTTSSGTEPDKWHLIPAGTVDQPDVDKVILQELEEELGLKAIDSFSVFGVFDTGTSQGEKIEIVYLFKLRHLTFDELHKSFVGDSEHKEIMGVSEFPGSLSLTEVAAASLQVFFK